MIKKALTLEALLVTVAYGKDYSQYKTDKLISADVAKDLIKKENVVLIDVRPESTFMLSNVKGSYHFWRPDMEPKDKRYGEIGGMRASRDELETELNKIGINNDTTLVLIGGGLDEYRLWWILDLYGVENVKIVDGGFAALKDAGAPTGMGRGAKEKEGNFEFPNNPDRANLASIDDVKEALEDKSATILDTRTEEEFHGVKNYDGSWIEWSHNAEDGHVELEVSN